MTDINVISYLAGKGLRGRQGSGNEVTYPCFFDCQESPNSNKRKLYINTEDGFYVCFVCGAQGGTYLLQKHFGDDPKRPEIGEDPLIRRKILNWAAKTGAQMLSNNDDVMLYLLNERGLSPESIVDRQLGFIGNNWSLTGSLPEEFARKELTGTGLIATDGPRTGKDWFYNHLLMPYMTRGNVVGMRGRLWDGKGAKYLTGQHDITRLFNIDSLDGADDVIVTEGEFDAMVLHQHLRGSGDERAHRIAVVGLSGVNGFPDGAEAYFSNAKRIYLGFDPDEPGLRAAVKLKEQFGNRGRILQLPDTLPKCDWSEYLLPIHESADADWHARHPYAGHTWLDVMGLIGGASGKRIFSIKETGFSARAKLAANPNGIKTGFSRLDRAIAPGLLPGQVVVVLAKTGVGKTNFLCNMAWNVRDKPILFISLEMTREEVYARLMRIALFHHPRWDSDQIERALANIWICDANRLSEKDIEELLSEFQVETGARPELAFVDYLGYFARGARGNSAYEKTTNAIMALKAVAKAKEGPIALVVPAQVNRGADSGKPIDLDDARDSGAIEETADFLLSLWSPDKALEAKSNINNQDGSAIATVKSGIVNLSILKSRHGNAGGDPIRLQFDSLTLALVDNDGPNGDRARDHNRLATAGWTYESLRERDTAPEPIPMRFHKD